MPQAMGNKIKVKVKTKSKSKQVFCIIGFE
jgi:hypothetical protein